MVITGNRYQDLHNNSTCFALYNMCTITSHTVLK